MQARLSGDDVLGQHKKRRLDKAGRLESIKAGREGREGLWKDRWEKKKQAGGLRNDQVACRLALSCSWLALVLSCSCLVLLLPCLALSCYHQVASCTPSLPRTAVVCCRVPNARACVL